MNTTTAGTAPANDTEETCPDGCDMRPADDSFDHLFGVHRLPPYLECNVCGKTECMPESEL